MLFALPTAKNIESPVERAKLYSKFYTWKGTFDYRNVSDTQRLEIITKYNVMCIIVRTRITEIDLNFYRTYFPWLNEYKVDNYVIVDLRER